MHATMVDQNTFASGPYVSVWVGQHRTEEELDDYLHSRFSEEFCFRVDDRGLPELSVEQEAVSPALLIRGFSRADKFQDEFIHAAERLGIHAARSAMVFYFLAYAPEGLPVAASPEMAYVGNFWFEGFSGPDEREFP
jgi:hypothetical protein